MPPDHLPSSADLLDRAEKARAQARRLVAELRVTMQVSREILECANDRALASVDWSTLRSLQRD